MKHLPRMQALFHVSSLKWHTCLWVLLPLCIFTVGWMNWWVALPLLMLMAAGIFYRADAPAADAPPDYPQSLWTPASVAVAACFTAFMFISGWGDWGNAHPDHIVRNACLRELVATPWPVIFPDGDELVYNIGYWLPAALIGKQAGLDAARLFTPLWGAWGLWLCWHWLCVFARRQTWVFALLLILFGSLLNLQCWLDLELLRLHYFGIAEQIMCSANAALPVLLCFIFLASGRAPLTWHPLLIACMAFYSPLAAIGGFLPALCQWWRQWRRQGYPRYVFIHPSMWAAVMAGGCFLLYYGHVNAPSSKMGIRPFYTEWDDAWLILTSFLIYGLFCLRDCRKNPLFFCVLITGALLPFFYIMGDVNDLLCKGCVPLMACMTAFLARSWALRPAYRPWIIALLIIGFAPRFNLPYYLCFFEPVKQALEPEKPADTRFSREWQTLTYTPKAAHQNQWGATMHHPGHRWYPYYSGTPNKWTRLVFRRE